MAEQTEKIYSTKPQDYSPFVGSLFYARREYRRARELDALSFFSDYVLTLVGLTGLNILTGVEGTKAVLQGLDALLK